MDFWFKTKQNRLGLDMGCEGRQASIFQGLGFLGGREKHGSVTEVESSGGAQIFLGGGESHQHFPLDVINFSVRSSGVTGVSTSQAQSEQEIEI